MAVANPLIHEAHMKLWEILIPVYSNEGREYHISRHQIWDNKVVALAGGLTIFRPVKGRWVSKKPCTQKEEMIPVRIICDDSVALDIARMTAKHYYQDVVLIYKVSDQAMLVVREDE